MQASGEVAGNLYYLSKASAEKLNLKIEKTVKGSELVGLKYNSPFDNLDRIKQALGGYEHQVIASDPLILPITEEEGTSLVHIAPGAGSEDFQLSKKIKLPVVELIDESASYLDKMGDFSSKNAKEDPKIILDYLTNFENGKYLFQIVSYTHQYPTCWRCKKELVWRVVDEWYISMEKLRKPLIKIVEKINWIPSFGRDRELDWFKNMHDWLISKKRYWGLALPIFECKCGNFEVIGSKEELQKRAVEGWSEFAAVGEPRPGEPGRDGHSPHRPWVDNVKIKCSKCGEAVLRIKDVGNPWLDAGIVPFSTTKYFENKKYWKKWFPVELVCESFPGQFKNWFYSLLVMSAVLENENPVKTIFGYASVRDEKGEEMHKSKGNAIWFDDAVEKVGADPMRWLYAKQNPADNLLFGYHNIDEVKRKLLIFYNVFTFLNTYATKEEFPQDLSRLGFNNVLDKWIVSKLNGLIDKSTQDLDNFNPGAFGNAVEDFFINDLSLWYLRRSRDRFHQEGQDKKEAIDTLYYVLIELIKLMAPVMPFFTEEIYQGLRQDSMPESVHLCLWPQVDKKKIDKGLEEKMDKVRKIVSLALAERMAKTIKVRQPLALLKIHPVIRQGAPSNDGAKLRIQDSDELLQLIKDEVNVKEIIFDEKITGEVELDTNLTEELKEEGTIREIIRAVQAQRKEQNLVPQDKVSLVEIVAPKKEKLIIEKNTEFLLKEFRAVEISVKEQIDIEEKIKIIIKN